MSSHYFLIRGRQSGLVLDIEGGETEPETPVILFDETGEANQLWYIDQIDGCIRSKASYNMCLDIARDNTLIINEFSGIENQLWKYKEDEGIIRGRNQYDKCIDVAAGETDAGSRVCVWEPTGEDNQLFDLEYLEEPQYFYFVSQMNDKAIDIQGGDPSAGTKLIAWEKTENENQHFYQDKDGIIRARLNHFFFECARKTGKSIELQPESGRRFQQWTFWAERICNVDEHDDIVEIKRAEDEDGAKVGYDEWSNGAHQRWRKEYV